jgi:antitoxin component of RelBE/YafQ-DinJ toxin-antitoxin module
MCVDTDESKRTKSHYLTDTIPKVYTFGMSNYAVINLKVDPDLKALAAKTADKLGVSISAVLNNELRRFTAEQSVVFELPEVPNATTAAQMAASRQAIEAGDYHRFDDNEKSLDFLANELS